MTGFRIPTWLKVAFWIFWLALFLSYVLAPLYMGPVDPPIPP